MTNYNRAPRPPETLGDRLCTWALATLWTLLIVVVIYAWLVQP